MEQRTPTRDAGYIEHFVSQYIIDVFLMSFRFDRNRSGEGVIVYVQDDIPSKQLTK